jgi:hypothetical protein
MNQRKYSLVWRLSDFLVGGGIVLCCQTVAYITLSGRLNDELEFSFIENHENPYDSLCPARDWNQALPKYQSRALSWHQPAQSFPLLKIDA